MRKSIPVLLLLLLSVCSYSQIVKLESVKKIKGSKLIVGLTGNEELNKSLKEAVENHWGFNKVVEYLPKKEAYAKAKGDDNLVVLSLGSTKSQSLSHETGVPGFKYRYVSKGKHIEVSTGKGKPLLKHYIPTFGKEGVITKEILVFGLSSLEYLCKTMISNNLKSNYKYKPAYKKRSSELQTTKLYVLDLWLSSKVKKEEIASLYPYPIEIVNYEKWSEAILSKQEGISYSIIVPVPIGGDYFYQHYLVNANTGVVYGVYAPKVVTKAGNLNVTKTNVGYTNKKILQKYSGVIEGKW